MSEKDRANVAAIIESAGKIKTFVSGINSADEFYRDDKTFDAVLMNFVIIGEAAGKLSDTAKKQYSDVPLGKSEIIQKPGGAQLFWGGCRGGLAAYSARLAGTTSPLETELDDTILF